MGGEDLKRLARLADIVASSQYEGEVENALRALGRELREIRALRDITMGDLVGAARERDLATANAVELQREVMALQAEIDHLRSNGNAVALWSDVAEAGADFRATACWALDLQRQGLTYLSLTEIDFLGNCVNWRGRRLTAPMQSWLRDLTDKIVRRTGQAPPA